MTPSPADLAPDSQYLLALQCEAARAGREVVVGAVIVDRLGRAFAQQRAPARRLFPGCWDIAGGHVEPGETIYAALAREIHEETGWRLRRILELIEVFDWETEDGGRRGERREFDFLVAVDGDLARPLLEPGKVGAFRWVSLREAGLLKENRPAGDDALYRVVKQGLERYPRLAGSRRA